MDWMSAIVTPTRRWALNYYITRSRQEIRQLENRQVRDKIWQSKPALSREQGLRASGPPVEHQKNENDTTPMAIRVRVNICCSYVRSPTPSHTQPFRTLQINWEVNFFKEVFARPLLLSRCDSFCMNLHIWVYNNHHHHHHQVELLTLISRTLSRHLSLSAIAFGRSSWKHLVSAQRWWI